MCVRARTGMPAIPMPLVQRPRPPLTGVSLWTRTCCGLAVCASLPARAHMCTLAFPCLLAVEMVPLADSVPALHARRAYISEARRIETTVPPQLRDKIVEHYVAIRRDEEKSDQPYTYTSPRTLLSILRLSQALVCPVLAAALNQALASPARLPSFPPPPRVASAPARSRGRAGGCLSWWWWRWPAAQARLRFDKNVIESDVDEALRLMDATKAMLHRDTGPTDRSPCCCAVLASCPAAGQSIAAIATCVAWCGRVAAAAVAGAPTSSAASTRSSASASARSSAPPGARRAQKVRLARSALRGPRRASPMRWLAAPRAGERALLLLCRGRLPVAALLGRPRARRARGSQQGKPGCVPAPIPGARHPPLVRRPQLDHVDLKRIIDTTRPTSPCQ